MTHCPICRVPDTVQAVWKEAGQAVCACSHCGHGWTRGYEGFSETDYWDESGFDAQYWREGRRRSFEALLDRWAPGRLLDYGSGPGVFVAMARARGIDAIGYDPSPQAVQLSRRLGPNHRVTSDWPPANDPFDFITLWDVLEHLPAPEETLRTLREQLLEGGRLFVQCPNFGFHLFYQGFWRLLGRGGTLHPTSHLHQFTARSLELVLHHAGFRNIRHVSLPPTRALPPVPHVVKQMWNKTATLVRKRTGLHMGHALCVIAER